MLAKLSGLSKRAAKRELALDAMKMLFGSQFREKLGSLGKKSVFRKSGNIMPNQKHRTELLIS